MKKAMAVLSGLIIGSVAWAVDVELSAPITNVMTVSRVQVDMVTVDLNALSGQTNRIAITAPYRWVDESNQVVRTGTARITKADIQSIMGNDATNEINRLMGLVNQVVQGVVR